MNQPPFSFSCSIPKILLGILAVMLLFVWLCNQPDGQDLGAGYYLWYMERGYAVVYQREAGDGGGPGILPPATAQVPLYEDAYLTCLTFEERYILGKLRTYGDAATATYWIIDKAHAPAWPSSRDSSARAAFDRALMANVIGPLDSVAYEQFLQARSITARLGEEWMVR